MAQNYYTIALSSGITSVAQFAPKPTNLPTHVDPFGDDFGNVTDPGAAQGGTYDANPINQIKLFIGRVGTTDIYAKQQPQSYPAYILARMKPIENIQLAQYVQQGLVTVLKNNTTVCDADFILGMSYLEVNQTSNAEPET